MMRKLNCFVGVCCLGAIISSFSPSLFAQVSPPTAPATRIPNFDIPNVTILFDRTLDLRAGTDPTNLDFTARRITEAHRLAQQQVELAIRFLERNQQAIIRGEIPEFNAIFGDVSQRNPAVVLSSRPVGGVFTVDPNVPNLLTFAGSSGAAAAADFQSGDSIYFAGGTLPGQSPSSAGFRGIVEQVIITDPASGDGTMVLRQALINAQGFPISVGFPGQLWKVKREEQRGDPTRFDQILNTYRSIRSALQGINPNTAGNNQGGAAARLPITYNGAFTDIAGLYGAGSVSVQGLGFQGYPADRLTREAGLSRSDSQAHVQNLNQLGPGTPGLRPLLWTNDNAPSYRQIRIINPNSQNIRPTAQITRTNHNAAFPNGTLRGGTLGGDISRSFYFDRQTIFGAPDNPNQQFVGYAFILDRINHFGRFDDNGIALQPPLDNLVRRIQALDANGQVRQDVNGNPITTPVNLPDSGDAARQTLGTANDWKEIVRSFAEFSTNTNPQGNILGGAFVGIQNILGSSVAGPLSQFDAGNYARFADFFRSNPGAGSGGNFEPFGKRASAGFNPIVPLQ